MNRYDMRSLNEAFQRVTNIPIIENSIIDSAQQDSKQVAQSIIDDYGSKLTLSQEDNLGGLHAVKHSMGAESNTSEKTAMVSDIASRIMGANAPKEVIQHLNKLGGKLTWNILAITQSNNNPQVKRFYYLLKSLSSEKGREREHHTKQWLDRMKNNGYISR